MANKTGIFPGLNAGLPGSHPFVTFCTIIHFHPVPGVPLDTGDILAPYIPTVAGNTIFLVYRHGGHAAAGFMALVTRHFAHEYMSAMGEKDTIRLP